MKDKRLLILLDAYLDGALTPVEKEELERALLESAAARKEFWRRASLHGWSYAAAKVNYGARTIPALESKTWWDRARAAFFDVWQAVKQARQWRLQIGIATACVVMLAGIVLYERHTRPVETELARDAVSTTNGVAMLARTAGVVWARPNDLDVGASLSTGWLRLSSGAIQLEFYGGARAVLEGPAALELISPQEAHLHYGRLNAYVNEQARGFTVQAGDFTVVDLGTEFGIDRQPELPAEVQVFNGQVEVAMKSSRQPARVLNAGEAVRVSPKELQPIAVNRENFLSADELARREESELREHYEAWQQASQALRRDRALLVYFDFQNSGGPAGLLTNRTSSARPDSHGTIVGCEWTEGRWPGKGALEFKRPGDQVRLRVPGQFDSLTYIAWVRVDGLPNNWNGLAMTQTSRAGEVHWQFLRNGEMTLSVHHEGGEDRGWETVRSRPIATPEYTGRWMQLAAVYDGPGRQMSVYVNGQLAAVKKITTPLKLHVGTFALGNWNPLASGNASMRARFQRQDFDFLVRNFRGRMDEFALYSRPLSAAEIRRQYELGSQRDSGSMAGLNQFN